MSVEWFLKLKEIDSLTKMRTSLTLKMKEQEDRVSKLDERRQEALLQTAKLRHDLVSLQGEVAELDKKINIASEQKQRLLDIGGDEKKIETFGNEISVLEEKGLEFLSQIETIESELLDQKQFLAGIEKTIKEIGDEARVEIDQHLAEIKNLQLRISSLMEEIPAEFKRILEKVSSKNLAHGPFTRVENGSCYFCRYKISRIDESEIDMQKNLKTCPQCGRIFLPYGS